MQSPTNILLPQFGAQNWAPIKPLLSLKGADSLPSHYICDALRERFDHYSKQNERTWREIYSVGELVSRFIEGQQILRPNPYGGWMVRPVPQEGEFSKRVVNLMQFYADNCITKWVQSNPDILVTPGTDRDEAQEAAKAGGVVVDHYERLWYDYWFNQKEGNLALRWGTYINRIRMDAGRKGLILLRDIVQQSPQKVGVGFGFCGDCGKGGSADEFEHPDYPITEEVMRAGSTLLGKCPQCQSDAAMVTPPAFAQVSNVVSQEEVQTGDLICEQLPLPACRWDLNRRAEESDWFIYQQRTNLAAVRNALGRVKIPQGTDDSTGLSILEALANAGQAISGVSGSNVTGDSSLYKEQVTQVEFYLTPDAYGDIEIKGDEKTVSGGDLPKGRLGDIFPNGLVAVGLNGLKVVTGIYGESHQRQIVSGQYFMRPLSGAGRPVSDMVEVQKRFNTFDSQALDYFGSIGTPAILYNKKAIQPDEARYIGHPKTNIPVDPTKLPETAKLAEAVHQLSPQSPAAGFMQYTYDTLNNFFQLTSHVTDFSGGLPGVNNDTATGAQIAAANSNSLFSPMLQIKAGVRKRAAELTVEQYRERFPMKRYFPLKGKYGRQQGMYLAGAQLNVDLVFEVVEDSELPNNTHTKRQTRNEFYMLFGGFPVYVQMKTQYPQIVSDLEQLYNIRIDGQDYDEIATLCRQRLEQMKQGEQAGAQNPEQFIQFIQPPVSTHEPSMEQKAKWFSDYLDTDEGQEASLPLRSGVEMVIDMFMNGGVVQNTTMAFNQGLTEVAGQAPQALGQQLLQQGQPDPNAQAEQQAQAQSQQTAQEQEGQLQSQALQQGHEAEQASNQQAHEQQTQANEMAMRLAEMKHEKEVARMRPKGASK
jgi:hypothetical protein